MTRASGCAFFGPLEPDWNRRDAKWAGQNGWGTLGETQLIDRQQLIGPATMK